MEAWLHGIPPAVIATQPWLLFWRGVGWMGWRHADGQHDLKAAFTAFREQQDTIGMFLAWAAVIFAYMSEGELVSMDRWIPSDASGGAPRGAHETILTASASSPAAIAIPPMGAWGARAGVESLEARTRPLRSAWPRRTGAHLLGELHRGIAFATCSKEAELLGDGRDRELQVG